MNPRVQELALLPDGWFEEGESFAPSLEASILTSFIFDALEAHPAIGEFSVFASIEGGYSLEFLAHNSHTVLSIDNNEVISIHKIIVNSEDRTLNIYRRADNIKEEEIIPFLLQGD
jgi:hypothetical protein